MLGRRGGTENPHGSQEVPVRVALAEVLPAVRCYRLTCPQDSVRAPHLGASSPHALCKLLS